MDYLLPDDGTMELMRKEFEKLQTGTSVRSLAFSSESGNAAANTTYIKGLLLFLYFVKILGYNTCYGTQIYDSHGSMGRVRSNEFVFGQLNNLF